MTTPIRIHNIGAKSLVYNEIKTKLISKHFSVSDDTHLISNEKSAREIRLESSSGSWLLPNADYYVLWAGQSDPLMCELNPKETRLINVDKTKELIDKISLTGGRVIYPSSNLVFSGNEAFVEAERITEPRNEYARQKSEIENYLMKRYPDDGHLILRMTKVWSSRAKFYQRWERERLEGVPIRVSQNRMVSPITSSYIVNVLSYSVSELSRSKSQIINLGANFEISQSEMAKKIYEKRNIQGVLFEEFVEPTESKSGLIHNSLTPSLNIVQWNESEFWKYSFGRNS